MLVKRILILPVFLFLVCYILRGQGDTIIIHGLIAEVLLSESITLYPNSTFKWTSEYDLSWDEFGDYEWGENKLILKYYDSSISSKDLTSKEYSKIETLLVKKDQFFRLKKSGKKIRRRRDRSIRTKWSWIRFHYHKYKLTKV